MLKTYGGTNNQNTETQSSKIGTGTNSSNQGCGFWGGALSKKQHITVQVFFEAMSAQLPGDIQICLQYQAVSVSCSS